MRALHVRDARRSPSADDPAEDLTCVLDAAVVRIDALELRSAIRRAMLMGPAAAAAEAAAQEDSSATAQASGGGSGGGISGGSGGGRDHQILPATSSRRICIPPFLSHVASCDAASNVCQAHGPPRHPPHSNPRFWSNLHRVTCRVLCI